MSSIEQRIKQLRLLHSVVSLSLTVVLLIAYYLLSKEGKIMISGGITAPMEIAIVLCLALLVLAGYFIFKSRSKKYQEITELPKRMEQVRISMIIHYAFIEAAVFLSVIVFYTTGTRNFFLYGLLLTVYLLYLRPNDERMNKELGIESK